MKKAFLFLIFLMHISLCFAQKNQLKLPSDNKLKISLDTLVDQSVSAFMKNNSRVGISIGIIEDGKPYLYNYGSVQRKNQNYQQAILFTNLHPLQKHLGQPCLHKLFSIKR